jgi:hypothetical protein
MLFHWFYKVLGPGPKESRILRIPIDHVEVIDYFDIAIGKGTFSKVLISEAPPSKKVTF